MRLSAEESLDIIDQALEDTSLTQEQEELFCALWEGKQYKEIGGTEEETKFKNQGYKLFQLLEKALGEKVKKRNLRDVVKRYLKRNEIIIKDNNNNSQIIIIPKRDVNVKDFNFSLNHCPIQKFIDDK